MGCKDFLKMIAMAAKGDVFVKISIASLLHAACVKQNVEEEEAGSSSPFHVQEGQDGGDDLCKKTFLFLCTMT